MRKKRKFGGFEFSERRTLLLIGDLTLLAASLVAYVFFSEKQKIGFEIIKNNPEWFITLPVLWLFYSSVFNLYNLSVSADKVAVLKNVMPAVFLTVLTYLFVPFLTPVLPESRLPALIFIATAMIAVGSWRAFYSLVFTQPYFLKRVLLVGTGNAARMLTDVVLERTGKAAHFGYRIVGFIGKPEQKKKENTYKDIRVIGDQTDIYKLVRRLNIDEVIIASEHAESPQGRLYAELIRCRNAGVAVTALTDVFETLTGRVPVEYTDDEFYLTFPYNKIAENRFYKLFKRLTDVFWGLIGCLLLFIMLPFVFIINLLFNRGPIFYSQNRVGRAGKIFKINKLRTMIPGAEAATGPVWASEKDKRITPFGRFLRKSRLDELPQFWNVLKGEMSLIGPRPERPEFVSELSKDIPFYDTRHLVKPGITGWAQVMYKYTSDKEDILIKLQFDIYYIKNRSELIDLKIILKTIGVVLGFKGM